MIWVRAGIRDRDLVVTAIKFPVSKEARNLLTGLPNIDFSK
jgi:hypothetical protein